MTKHARADSRRQDILSAALEAFVEHGYEATSIAELCRRSGASVGSVYHHFGSKPGIAAVLYLEGIRQVHQSTLAALLGTRSVDAGLSSLSESYLRWVENHPEYAKFLLKYRHADFMADVAEELRAANRCFRKVIVDWAQPHMQRGALPAVEAEIYSALLIAPAEQYARAWLAGRARTPMPTARKMLTAAVVAAIRALAE